jgi:hypothetical protein
VLNLALYPPRHIGHDDVIIIVPPSAGPTEIRLVVLETRAGKTKMGFEAPRTVTIDRGRIHRAKLAGEPKP